MNVSKQIITEEELHAFVDGRLAAKQRDAVEQYLAGNPEEAERIRVYQKLNHSLQQAYAPQLQEPLPKRLHVKGFPTRWIFLQHPLVASAAALLMLTTGGVTGWLLHAEQNLNKTIIASLAKPAYVAHVVYTPEVLHPVEVDAQHEQHLFKWLSNRLGGNVKAPDISRLGYHLVGGRLLPAEEKPAAQFMYENQSGTRLTLYIRSGFTENRETAFRYNQQQGIGTFYWVDRSFGYALSGSLPREELLNIADALYAAFTG